MIRPRRRFPVGQNRNYHAAQALVTRHTSHTLRCGWKKGWRKEIHPSIMVRFVDQRCCDGTSRHTLKPRIDSEHSNHLPNQEFELGFSGVERRNLFPVGTEVEVSFSLTGNPHEMFLFHGVDKRKRLPLSSAKQLQAT